MLFEAEFAKETMGVGRQDFPGRMVGIKRESDRHEAPHQVRIAVAAVTQRFFACRIDASAEFQPHLADAPANLVGVIVGGLAQRFERPAEFKNVAIPIFPIVEKGKIAANGFRVGQRGVLRLPSPPLYRQAPTPRQCG